MASSSPPPCSSPLSWSGVQAAPYPLAGWRSLLLLQPRSGNNPHKWSLVELRLRIQDDLCFCPGNPYCFMNLSSETGVVESNNLHGEICLLAEMLIDTMFPERTFLTFLPEPFLVLPAPCKGIPSSFTFIGGFLSYLEACQARDFVCYRIFFTISFLCPSWAAG